MTNYYTSDWHFHHKNIIEYENRGFNSVEEMNNYLTTKWNSQVLNEDTIYYFGDLVIGNKQKFMDTLRQLKGRIIFIKGNHDNDKWCKEALKEGLIHEYHQLGFEMKLGKEVLYCSHYPLEIGLRPHKWSISGHIHGKDNTHLNQLNVGIDSPVLEGFPRGTMLSEGNLLFLIEERTKFIKEQGLYGI